MKKLLMFTIGFLLSLSVFSQGDCFSTATQISSCGYIYAGNNAGFGDCPGSLCSCVGGSSNPSNLDDDCGTACSACQTPCGSDFLGSVENSIFWYFEPTESCDFQLCVTADNCCCGQGGGPYFMQVWIGQRDTTTGTITAYHVNDNSNTSITGGNQVCYTFSVNQADGDLVIMVDGNAGSECDIWLDLNQVNCTDTCPVVTNPNMAVDWLYVKSKVVGTTNVVSWSVIQENTSIYNIQRSSDGKKFETISSKLPKEDGTITYTYTDVKPEAGRNYYRIQEVDESGRKDYSKVVHTFNNVEDLFGETEELYDLMGNDIGETIDGKVVLPETYKGFYIIKYSSGRIKKDVAQ